MTPAPARIALAVPRDKGCLQQKRQSVAASHHLQPQALSVSTMGRTAY
jgi:hypothetical protein